MGEGTVKQEEKTRGILMEDKKQGRLGEGGKGTLRELLKIRKYIPCKAG